MGCKIYKIKIAITESLEKTSLVFLLVIVTPSSSNVHESPRSQNCVMESKLQLQESTKRTLERDKSFVREISPNQEILHFELSPNDTCS
jgi:hypothetical protein